MTDAHNVVTMTTMRNANRTAVGCRELKTRLGTYLRQVQRGRVIVVTERGRPVAELRPIPIEDDEEKAKMSELVALGLLTHESSASLAPLKPVPISGKSLSQTILEDREDRF